MKNLMCQVCGLVESTGICLDCEAIRQHRFTDCTVMVVDGSWSPDHPKIGGAGIVLVDDGPTGEVVGQRYCGFKCHGSQDAEYQAIARAHLWAPSTLIYSDAMFVVRRLQGYRRTRIAVGQQVRYLHHAPHLRNDAYRQAHRLSVQGRRAATNRELANRAITHDLGQRQAEIKERDP
jgi:hypothetical protein